MAGLPGKVPGNCRVPWVRTSPASGPLWSPALHHCALTLPLTPESVSAFLTGTLDLLRFPPHPQGPHLPVFFPQGPHSRVRKGLARWVPGADLFFSCNTDPIPAKLSSAAGCSPRVTLAGLQKALLGGLVRSWAASDCLSGRTSEWGSLGVGRPCAEAGGRRERGGGEGSAGKCRLLIAPAFPTEQLLPV